MNHISDKSLKTKQKIAGEIYTYRKNVKDKLESLVKNGILRTEEAQSLMEAMTNIEGYMRDKDSKVSEEVKIMGDENYVAWSDRLRIEGMEKGMELNLIKTLCKKIRKDKTPEEIAEDLEEDYARIKIIYDEAIKHKPDYNAEVIYNALHDNALVK